MPIPIIWERSKRNWLNMNSPPSQNKEKGVADCGSYIISTKQSSQLQDPDNQGKLTQRLISLPKAMLKIQI